MVPLMYHYAVLLILVVLPRYHFSPCRITIDCIPWAYDIYENYHNSVDLLNC